MTRAVYDTNVLLSALLFGGSVFDELMTATVDGRVQLITSPFILRELDRIVWQKFCLPRSDRQELKALIKRRSIIVAPRTIPHVIKRKRDDNAILACAVAGCADLLVTGDKKDLLILREYSGIPIVSPRILYDLLQMEKK
jgi:putative PIN family toxin of toxin-antitoxin system